MKRKNLFLILLMFFLNSVLSFADNVKDIKRYIEATMKNKVESNFV